MDLLNTGPMPGIPTRPQLVLNQGYFASRGHLAMPRALLVALTGGKGEAWGVPPTSSG